MNMTEERENAYVQARLEFRMRDALMLAASMDELELRRAQHKYRDVYQIWMNSGAYRQPRKDDRGE